MTTIMTHNRIASIKLITPRVFHPLANNHHVRTGAAINSEKKTIKIVVEQDDFSDLLSSDIMKLFLYFTHAKEQHK